MEGMRGNAKLTLAIELSRLLARPILSSVFLRGRRGAMPTSEDYRQLAERCATLARECAAPDVAEALRTLALGYLTRAVYSTTGEKAVDTTICQH